MPSRAHVVVGLDGDVHLRADDPMVTRGDGVFETLLVRDGRARLLDAHLSRLRDSAATIGLPAPDDDGYRSAVDAAVSQWTGGEAMLRLLHGRGTSGTRGFVTVSPLPERVAMARRDGVAAVCLDTGCPASDATDAAWSLATVKSLSYGHFAAAQRQAALSGAGEAILVSSDRWVLEGARSTVVVSPEPGVLQTPPPSAPILRGTTVDALFAAARRRGWRCEPAPLRVGDLHAAQGLWLCSSVTLIARVHTLDGKALPTAPAADEVAELMELAIEAD